MTDKETISDGVDYGPLACLIGRWGGKMGLDKAPEPDGEEQTPYAETLMFEAIGSVTNAEQQTLAALRYHQVVSRQSDGAVFHNETGYWMWDAGSQTVMHSVTIPRGLSLLAGGIYDSASEKDRVFLAVEAKIGDTCWGIVQSPFMSAHAKTVSYQQDISVVGDELMYSQTMMLDIYGREFEHTDSNILMRE